MQKNSINHMLDLKIENFGPITTGNIVLKPLTILMGTNNSGKSYAALLIYSILNNQYHTMHETVEKIFSKIYEKTRDRETDTSIIESFSIKIKIEIYKNLEEELRRNFAELSNIVQINQKTSFLKISSASLQSEITISGNKTSHPVEPTQVIYVKTEDPSSSAEPIFN